MMDTKSELFRVSERFRFDYEGFSNYCFENHPEYVWCVGDKEYCWVGVEIKLANSYFQSRGLNTIGD
jgi:hypothetical protein